MRSAQAAPADHFPYCNAFHDWICEPNPSDFEECVQICVGENSSLCLISMHLSPQDTSAGALVSLIYTY